MYGIPVSLQIERLRQPLKKALHTAGRLSYDGVQINAHGELRPGELTDTGLRQLRKMLNDLNLRISAVRLPTRSGLASSDRVDARVDAIQQSMQLASRLQARILLTNLGRLPDADDRERVMLDDVIKQLSTLGQRVGVELVVSPADAPTHELAAYVDALPAAAVGVDLNPAELIGARVEPRDFVEAIGPHIRHIWANDAVAGLGRLSAEEVELGRGSADFPELIGMMEQFDYRGWTTVAPRNVPDVEGELADALQYLRSL